MGDPDGYLAPAFVAEREALCGNHARPSVKNVGLLLFSVPTVLRVGPYRLFFFFAGDRNEPPHVHVERDADRAKVWLDPVRLYDSGGFSRSEIARIILMVREHELALLRSWYDYFTD